MSDMLEDGVSQTEAGHWLSVQDAARLLAVSERTIYRRADRGQLRRQTLTDGRVEIWVPAWAGQRAPDSRHDVSDPDVDYERSVQLVDRVSTAVSRQLEALTFELAASRERIEVLARENGVLTERTALLERMLGERELAAVTSLSDDDRHPVRIEVELEPTAIQDTVEPTPPQDLEVVAPSQVAHSTHVVEGPAPTTGSVDEPVLPDVPPPQAVTLTQDANQPARPLGPPGDAVALAAAAIIADRRRHEQPAAEPSEWQRVTVSDTPPSVSMRPRTRRNSPHAWRRGVSPRTWEALQLGFGMLCFVIAVIVLYLIAS